MTCTCTFSNIMYLYDKQFIMKDKYSFLYSPVAKYTIYFFYWW